MEATGNTMSGIGAFFKKVQGALPIVGLVSRLAAPEGGFDELAYPEYCRSVFDKAPPGMSVAMQELEKKYGKTASSKWILLMLWMTNTGLGAVTAKEILAAARRMRVTFDIEVEIDRFEGARLVSRKKYDMMAPPSAKPLEKAAVAVDALCTLCLGLKDGAAPAIDDGRRLVDIVSGSVQDVSREVVEAIVQDRIKRTGAYA